MTRKITLNVIVEISTNDELVSLGVLESITASHTKFCLLDNPDVDVYTIQDVDVQIVKSEEV